MVRSSSQSDALQGFDDTPEGPSSEKGRGTLNHCRPTLREMLLEESVERRSVEFSQGVIRWIWEIDNYKIKGAVGLLQPDEGIGVHDADPGGIEGVAIKLSEGGSCGE